jgi:lipopolysaccharide/colanic/teichoic acid biosynthesis glycosyltransferase
MIRQVDCLENRAGLSMAGFGVGAEVRQSRWCLSRTKRLMDVLVASSLCILFLPLCLLIAAAIALESRGGIFFRQWRTGYGGQRFQILKFRTMVADAEDRKADLRHLNRHGERSPDFKILHDPRVTTVGRFLRGTSLDELPNLVNVLNGTMSLVGPRPTSFGVERYEGWHLVRLTVLPGITGLWQISGRSEVDFDERVRLDYRYIRHQSLMLDVKILAKTLPSVIGRRGAC